MSFKGNRVREFGISTRQLHSGYEPDPTTGLRMERHVQNANALADYLNKDSRVRWIACPCLESHHASEAARKYLPKGAGVTPDFIRLSVGLRDIEDILYDLDQALNR